MQMGRAPWHRMDGLQGCGGASSLLGVHCALIFDLVLHIDYAPCAGAWPCPSTSAPGLPWTCEAPGCCRCCPLRCPDAAVRCAAVAAAPAAAVHCRTPGARGLLRVRLALRLMDQPPSNAASPVFFAGASARSSCWCGATSMQQTASCCRPPPPRGSLR